MEQRGEEELPWLAENLNNWYEYIGLPAPAPAVPLPPQPVPDAGLNTPERPGTPAELVTFEWAPLSPFQEILNDMNERVAREEEEGQLPELGVMPGLADDWAW